MDPKAPQNLDPKLKEAYDRVMGISVPATKPSSITPPPAQKAPPPVPPPPAPVAVPKPMPVPLNNTPVAEEKPKTSVTTSSSTFVSPTVNSHKSGGISPVILIFGIVTFFVVYAIFWLKFFNVSTLPGGFDLSSLSSIFLSFLPQ